MEVRRENVGRGMSIGKNEKSKIQGRIKEKIQEKAASMEMGETALNKGEKERRIIQI